MTHYLVAFATHAHMLASSSSETLVIYLRPCSWFHSFLFPLSLSISLSFCHSCGFPCFHCSTSSPPLCHCSYSDADALTTYSYIGRAAVESRSRELIHYSWYIRAAELLAIYSWTRQWKILFSEEAYLNKTLYLRSICDLSLIMQFKEDCILYTDR